jgi:membrane-bound ClpP family serine protease
MMLNAVTAITIYGIVVVSLMTWVFCSKQTRAPRTRKTARHIFLRTVPFCLIFFLICYVGNLDPISVAIVSAFVALISSAGGLLFAPVGLVFLCIGEWIIGFPSKESFFSKVPVHSVEEQRLLDESLIGAVAVVATPLHPSGKIIVGENEYEATSDLGFVEQGTKVIITGKKDFAFTVREEPEDLASGDPSDESVPR